MMHGYMVHGEENEHNDLNSNLHGSPCVTTIQILK